MQSSTSRQVEREREEQMSIQVDGDSVIITGTRVPAVNIQVEGYPKMHDGDFYPIYFETQVEDRNWVVHSWGEAIIVEKSDLIERMDGETEYALAHRIFFIHWGEFAAHYNLHGLMERHRQAQKEIRSDG
jgi:hypothetical protein